MRFFVFSGDNFYPSGGAFDLVEKCAFREVAIRLACRHLGIDSSRWAHVYDTETNKVIWKDGEDLICGTSDESAGT
jgi:hypothetical protein